MAETIGNVTSDEVALVAPRLATVGLRKVGNGIVLLARGIAVGMVFGEVHVVTIVTQATPLVLIASASISIEVYQEIPVAVSKLGTLADFLNGVPFGASHFSIAVHSSSVASNVAL